MADEPTTSVRDKLRKVLDDHMPARSATGGVTCDGLTECDWIGDEDEVKDHLADMLAAEIQPDVDCAAGITQAADALDRIAGHMAAKEPLSA